MSPTVQVLLSFGTLACVVTAAFFFGASYGYRSHQTDSGSAAGATSYSQLVTRSIAAGALAGTTDGASAGPCVVEQEVLAERAWWLSYDSNGPELWSVAHPVAWAGPTLEADSLPTAGNTHGIYALRSVKGSYDGYPVVGTVALSGRVVEGDTGYRGQRATVRSLRLRYLPDSTPVYSMGYGLYGSSAPLVWKERAWTIAQKLADRYQCECEIDWLAQSGLPAELVEV